MKINTKGQLKDYRTKGKMTLWTNSQDNNFDEEGLSR